MTDDTIKTNCPLCGYKLEGKPKQFVICPNCGEAGTIEQAAEYWEALNLNNKD